MAGSSAGVIGANDPTFGGILGDDPTPPQMQPWQGQLGMFGAALKDIGTSLRGGQSDNVMRYQQLMRQNALRQAYMMSATTNDPKEASQANAVILANGGDPSSIQKYRADQAMPALLAAISPKVTLNDNPVGVTPAVNATGTAVNSQQRQAAQNTNASPMTSMTPGMDVTDALAKINNPSLSQAVAPQMINARLAAQAAFNQPYTLQPGENRYVGNTKIAGAPALMKIAPNGVAYDPTNLQPGQTFSNPNQPFNSDGTPNAAFQNFEMAKARAPAIARVDATYGLGLPQGQSGLAPLVQSHVSNILSGNENMNNVPSPLRNAVSMAMAGAGKSQFAPIAQQRLTTAAGKIAAQYLANPSYKLAADGMPYIQRIAAAMKTPGSVSDQDLLDSLTKLNTGGNAVTDAQVELITGGKSYSDWANVLGNKLKNGGVLSNNQRQQVQTIANNIYSNYRQGYEPLYNELAGKLTSANIPKQFWPVPDIDSIAGQQAKALGLNQPRGSAGGNGSTQIPSGATAYLKSNPGLRAQFDAKYGTGASASVLGN